MYWTTTAWIGMRTFLSRLSPISWAAEKLAVLEWYNNKTRGEAGGLRPDGSQHGLPSERIQMTLTADEFAERVAEQYDPDFLVEILELSSEQLVYAFFEEILENQHKFDLWESENENTKREED